MLILLYFYLSNILNAGLLLVTEYFYTVVLQDLSTSSTSDDSSIFLSGNLEGSRGVLVAATVSSAAAIGWCEPEHPSRKIPLKVKDTDCSYTANVKSGKGNLFEDKEYKGRGFVSSPTNGC